MTISLCTTSKEYFYGQLWSKDLACEHKRKSFFWRHKLIQYGRSWHFDFIIITMKTTKQPQYLPIFPITFHNLHLKVYSRGRHKVPFYIFPHCLLYYDFKISRIPFSLIKLWLNSWLSLEIMSPCGCNDVFSFTFEQGNEKREQNLFSNISYFMPTNFYISFCHYNFFDIIASHMAFLYCEVYKYTDISVVRKLSS